MSKYKFSDGSFKDGEKSTKAMNRLTLKARKLMLKYGSDVFMTNVEHPRNRVGRIATLRYGVEGVGVQYWTSDQPLTDLESFLKHHATRRAIRLIDGGAAISRRSTADLRLVG